MLAGIFLHLEIFDCTSELNGFTFEYLSTFSVYLLLGIETEAN